MTTTEQEDLQIAENRIENPADIISLEEMIEEYEEENEPVERVK